MCKSCAFSINVIARKPHLTFKRDNSSNGIGTLIASIPSENEMVNQEIAEIFDHMSRVLAFWPAACIVVVALGFTLIGESMREALDPRQRR